MFFCGSTHAQSIELLKLDAQLKYKNQDFLGVIESMNKAILIAPKDGNCYYFRGLSKIFMGDNPGGCADLAIAKSFGVKTPDKNSLDFCVMMNLGLNT
ncbi:MAG: hypothetical protein HC906_14625 [Bacteroidales bacterium]|nr:hypothetical protein [Bacteroidales bacterium]